MTPAATVLTLQTSHLGTILQALAFNPIPFHRPRDKAEQVRMSPRATLQANKPGPHGGQGDFHSS